MPKHATATEKERWWELYMQGTTFRAIASRCGFSYQIVTRYINDRRCVEAIPQMPPKQEVEP